MTKICLPIVLAIPAIAGCGVASSSPDTGTATDATDDTDPSDDTGTDTTGDTDTDTTGDTDPTGEQQACWTDLGFGEAELFYQGFTGGSEGVAFGRVDGLLYVSSQGRIYQLDAEGSASEFASVPTALGLAGLADGSLIVASIGEINAADGAVYSVDTDGVETLLATGIDSPNFVVIAPDGSALISDDFDTRVFRVTLGGEVEVVIADVPSPNGMAYSPDGASFYVASTFTSDGQLTRYEVGDDGLPMEDSAVEILHLGMASTPDGIAVDIDGYVYVAANLPGQIWRVDGAATELEAGELVAEGLDFPASLAFGRGQGFDPCSIYLTQLQQDRIQRVFVGVRGADFYD